MEHQYIEAFDCNDGFSFSGAHLFSCGASRLLLSAQNGTMMLLSEELGNRLLIHDIPDDFKFKLVQRAFAQMMNSRPASNASENILPQFFMIDLTKACTLQCVYCFRDLEDKTVMSEQVLDDICRYIQRYCRDHHKKSINIQAWGGEPMLAFDYIRRIQSNFEGSGVDVQLFVETNGTTLTPELAREARQRKIKIGLSIDGLPDLHDKHRPMVSGKGSFDRMRSGLKAMHENGYSNCHTSITVVSKHTLPHIEEMVRYYCEDLKLPQFKFNIVKPNPMMKATGMEVAPAEVRDFAKRMFDALVMMHRKGYAAVEVNISTKILNVLKRGCSNICLSRGCMGGRKIIAFDQKARIYTCDLMDLQSDAFGSIYDDRDLVEMVDEAIDTHDFYRRKKDPRCTVCPWYFYCRGGCTSAVKYKTGSYGEGIDEVECAYNSVLYPEIIKLFLNEPQMLQSLVQDELTFYDAEHFA